MAIIIEAFEEVPSAIAGYALTDTQVSNVDGIPTNRYTFLKEGATVAVIPNTIRWINQKVLYLAWCGEQ